MLPVAVSPAAGARPPVPPVPESRGEAPRPEMPAGIPPLLSFILSVPVLVLEFFFSNFKVLWKLLGIARFVSLQLVQGSLPFGQGRVPPSSSPHPGATSSSSVAPVGLDTQHSCPPRPVGGLCLSSALVRALRTAGVFTWFAEGTGTFNTWEVIGIVSQMKARKTSWLEGVSSRGWKATVDDLVASQRRWRAGLFVSGLCNERG